MPELDPYSTLGVPRTASRDEIARAYRRLAKEHHPDAGGPPSPTMSRINDAWHTLSDAGRRARWDRAHTVIQPAPWSAPQPGTILRRPPPQPLATPSRRESGRVAALVIAGVAILLGASLIGLNAVLGPRDDRLDFSSDEISFKYDPAWSVYPGDSRVAEGHRVVAHLANVALERDEICTTAGNPCVTTGEPMPDGRVAVVITAWSEGVPPEPEPITERPFGLDADAIIGGRPAAMDVTQVSDVFVVWWQLSPGDFPERWIEVRADFRAGDRMDQDRIFATLQTLLDSVELGS